MTRIKLADITNEKPVRLVVELPARLHSELLAYAVAVNGGNREGAPTLDRIVPAMLNRFIITDRQYAKGKRNSRT